jgi:hypothetical protein
VYRKCGWFFAQNIQQSWRKKAPNFHCHYVTHCVWRQQRMWVGCVQ